MRQIERIFVHCSAGWQTSKAADIVLFHTGPKERKCLGWSKPGYHFFIEADGNTVQLLPIEEVSNGVKGYNATSINVCYAGGVDMSKPNMPPIDNRTPQQKEALLRLLRRLKEQFPNAKIHGHRDFANKACPSFDATAEYAGL